MANCNFEERRNLSHRELGRIAAHGRRAFLPPWPATVFPPAYRFSPGSLGDGQATRTRQRKKNATVAMA